MNSMRDHVVTSDLKWGVWTVQLRRYRREASVTSITSPFSFLSERSFVNRGKRQYSRLSGCDLGTFKVLISPTTTPKEIITVGHIFSFLIQEGCRRHKCIELAYMNKRKEYNCGIALEVGNVLFRKALSIAFDNKLLTTGIRNGFVDFLTIVHWPHDIITKLITQSDNNK